ncbi:MAG: hypothetical protein ACFFDN_34145 [Candidatus Hodarchaeota archaeon]
MRKTTFLIITLIFINIQAQEYYKTFGNEPRYHSLFLIEIVDQDTRELISGAKVKMESMMFRFPQILMSNDGVVALVFKILSSDKYREIIGEVTHPNYSFTEFKISKYELKNETDRTQLNLPNFEKFEPTSKEIAEELRKGRYNIYARNLMGNRSETVGCYKLKIEMKKIRSNENQSTKYNGSVNNKNNSRNYERENPPKSEILIKCENCNGTGNCKFCDGKGKIYSKNGSYTHCRKCGAQGKCAYCGGRGKILKHVR